MRRVHYLDGTYDDFEATTSAKIGLDAKGSDGWTVFIPWAAIKKIESLPDIPEP